MNIQVTKKKNTRIVTKHPNINSHNGSKDDEGTPESLDDLFEDPSISREYHVYSENLSHILNDSNDEEPLEEPEENLGEEKEEVVMYDDFQYYESIESNEVKEEEQEERTNSDETFGSLAEILTENERLDNMQYEDVEYEHKNYEGHVSIKEEDEENQYQITHLRKSLDIFADDDDTDSDSNDDSSSTTSSSSPQSFKSYVVFTKTSNAELLPPDYRKRVSSKTKYSKPDLAFQLSKSDYFETETEMSPDIMESLPKLPNTVEGHYEKNTAIDKALELIKKVHSANDEEEPSTKSSIEIEFEEFPNQDGIKSTSLNGKNKNSENISLKEVNFAIQNNLLKNTLKLNGAIKINHSKNKQAENEPYKLKEEPQNELNIKSTIENEPYKIKSDTNTDLEKQPFKKSDDLIINQIEQKSSELKNGLQSEFELKLSTKTDNSDKINKEIESYKSTTKSDYLENILLDYDLKNSKQHLFELESNVKSDYLDELNQFELNEDYQIKMSQSVAHSENFEPLGLNDDKLMHTIEMILLQVERKIYIYLLSTKTIPYSLIWYCYKHRKKARYLSNYHNYYLIFPGGFGRCYQKVSIINDCGRCCHYHTTNEKTLCIYKHRN